MKDEALSILEKLISCESVSPDISPAMDIIVECLSCIGFLYTDLTYGIPESAKCRNIFVIRNNGGTHLCFAGHTDVVPAQNPDLWKSKNPFKLVYYDDLLYGRGTVDMKGAIACFISATKKFITDFQDHNFTISFAITGNEEQDSTNGTPRIVEYLRNNNHLIPDYCILGEPTCRDVLGDISKPGRLGSAHFKIKINGTGGHTAYPEYAVNPIIDSAKIILAIQSINFKRIHGLEDSVVSFSAIDTDNKTKNLIPTETVINCNIRYGPLDRVEELCNIINTIIRNISNNYTLQYEISASPFYSENNLLKESISSAIKKITNIDTKFKTEGGTSDARFIHKICSTIEFGLRNNTAHAIDEYTTINEIEKLCAIYYEFIKNIMSINN